MHGLDNYGIGVEVLEFTGEDIIIVAIDAYIMNKYNYCLSIVLFTFLIVL